MKKLFVIILSIVLLSIILPTKVYAERELSNKEKNALKKKPSVLGKEGFGIYEGQETLFDEIKSLVGGETEKDKKEKATQEKAAEERMLQEKAAEAKAAEERMLQEKATQEKAAEERMLQEKATQEKAKKDTLEAAKALNCPTPKEGECLCSGKSIKHLKSEGEKLRALLVKSWRNCKIVLLNEDAEGTYQLSYNVDAKGELLPIKDTMIAKFKNGDIYDDQKKTFYDASANITCKSEDMIDECKTKFSDANKKWVNNMAYYYMYNHYIKRCVASGLITKNYHEKFLGKVKNLSGKFADYFKVDKKNIDSLKIEANQLWQSDLTKSREDALVSMAMVKMQLDIGFNQNSIGDVYMTDMGTMSMGKASILCDTVKNAYQQSMVTTMRAFKKDQSKKNPGSDDNLDF